MSNYQQLLQQALIVHENAQQSVRGPLSAKRISDAVDGFTAPFDQLEAALAKAKTGEGGDLNADAIRDALRSLSAQRDVLQSVIERAESDDDLTVKGVTVDQPKARERADKQKAVDQQFLAKVDEVLALARDDAGPQGGKSKPTSPFELSDEQLSGREDPPE